MNNWKCCGRDWDLATATADPPVQYEFCPICGKKRPEKLSVDELRAWELANTFYGVEQPSLRDWGPQLRARALSALDQAKNWFYADGYNSGFDQGQIKILGEILSIFHGTYIADWAKLRLERFSKQYHAQREKVILPGIDPDIMRNPIT